MYMKSEFVSLRSYLYTSKENFGGGVRPNVGGDGGRGELERRVHRDGGHLCDCRHRVLVRTIIGITISCRIKTIVIAILFFSSSGRSSVVGGIRHRAIARVPGEMPRADGGCGFGAMRFAGREEIHGCRGG